MKILIGMAICTCAWAQIQKPWLGNMLDANGAVRTVYGIAASVSLGDPEITGVISSACSKTFCLAKTEMGIISAAGFASAPPGPALFAIDGDYAFVWFSNSRQLARWQSGALTQIDSIVEGEVLSIRARSGSVEFAVRRASGVWIVSANGGVIDSLPPSAGPLTFITDGVVYSTRDEIVIRDMRFPLKHVTALSRMSDGYLQVRAGGLDYGVRLDKGREKVFQLPGVEP